MSDMEIYRHPPWNAPQRMAPLTGDQFLFAGALRDDQRYVVVLFARAEAADFVNQRIHYLL